MKRLTNSEIIQRYLQMQAEEAKNPLSQWWLSFCDPDLPEGSQFLGAVCIDAHGLADATHRVTVAGLNPGGEIMAVQIPEGRRVADSHCNRILDKQEALNAPREKEITGP